jgi:hypothetical protein
MTTLPQPPPDAPVPPPSAVAIRSRRFRFWIWIVGLVSVACVILVLRNVILVQRNNAFTTEAHANLRAMTCAFGEFDTDYGRFPDASTITEVRDRTGSLTPLGTKTSNDFLRQLIVAEILPTEVACYAAIAGCHKPDNRMGGTLTLEKGECGFSYIVGQSSKDNPERPLVVTPLIPGTNRFDPKPFNGFAIVLIIGGCPGGSVRIEPINKRGEVIDSSGKHILDPANPIWAGEPPVVVWPEF